MTDTFWIGFGDVHDEPGNIAAIPGLAEAEAVIISGDLTTRGGARGASRVIEETLRVNSRVFAQVGNMDGRDVAEYLRNQGVDIHARALELAPGVGLMGVGYSTPTPFNTPSEVADSQIKQWLEAAHEQAKDFKTLLLVAHDPPFGTAVDQVGAGNHVGSKAVREFIEAVQPDVCLTGHIHESAAKDTLGRTQVVNPGPLFGGGYAVISWEGDRLGAEIKQL